MNKRDFSVILFCVVYADSFSIHSNYERVQCDENNNVCHHGSTCETNGSYKFCKCKFGTYGNRCEIVTDCVEKTFTCSEESKAKCGFNIDTGKAECLCSDGQKYDKDNGTCRETCDKKNSNCQHGGKCETVGSYDFCKYKLGTYGSQCEFVTDCEGRTFDCSEESKAKCGFDVDTGKAECLCSDGQKYDKENGTCRETCDEQDVCLNGGTCKINGHYSFCECMPGTKGPKCGTVIDCEDGSLVCKPDSGSTCGFNINSKRAECLCKNELKYDTTSEKCRETCDKYNICLNGGMCVFIGHYSFCECMPGTKGPNCETIIKCEDGSLVCKPENGSTCGFNINSKRAECLCKDGLKYDMINEICRGTCIEGGDQCKNGATCKTYGSNSFCECLRGTSGTFCDTVDECIPENEKCGVNSGAECKYNEDLQVAECICDEKILVFDPNLKLCIDFTTTPGEFSTRSISVCDEDENDCVNGAECVRVGNQRFCDCLRGTYGDKCQHMRDCDERFNLKCNYRNGEICSFNTTSVESECLCVESELHYDTKQGKCRKTCLVGNYECKNGAYCKTYGGYGFCECLPGTYGDTCEIIRDCDIISCINSTGARCVYNRNSETAECVCDNGLKYDGYQCRETCDPAKNDCLNGAMCEKEGNYSFCRCILGSYGNKCEIVEDCESQKVICKENNGAKCGINIDTGVTECICENGLKYDEESLVCKETCNRMRDECKNGALCIRIGTYSFCDCLPGTSGDRCEKVEGEKNELTI